MKKIRMYNIIILLCSIFLLNGSCSSSDSSDDDPGGGNPPPTGGGNDYLQITLNPNSVHQTIHGFGASDAWSTQFVGKNWPLNKKEAIADLLFSNNFDAQGNPEGIGLNTWRFNIGAGSASQGNSSGIDDEWRRAESFLTSSGYDWNAQEGQRWFLNAAQQRGVNTFIGFSNSPPITLTKNGKSHSSGGSSANLDASNYDAYADFLVNVIDNLNSQYGIQLDYVSPFNEPQWDWTGGQEGTPWRNSEIAAVTAALNTKLQSSAASTKIELAEAGQLNFLYENANKSGRANQIEDFFSSGSSNYIGDLSSVAKKIAGHSYYTTYGTTYLLEVRQGVQDKIQSIDSALEFWMTEFCPIEDNAEINGNGRDLGIDSALYIARVIHSDLAIANASSWQWWLAVSPYDYKDGLIYIDDNQNDGQYFDSKILWTLGNYSKFIKQGYKRIGLSRSDNKSIEQSINGLLVSAYRNDANSKQVAVFVNQRTIDIPVKLSVSGKSSFSIKRYQTSGLSSDNLSFKGNASAGDIIEIPARSIVTVVLE